MSRKLRSANRKNESTGFDRIPREEPKFKFKQEVWYHDHPETKYVITCTPSEENNNTYGIREVEAASDKTQHRVSGDDLCMGPKYDGKKVMPKDRVKDEQVYLISRSKLDGRELGWVYEFQNYPTHAIPERQLREYTVSIPPDEQRGKTLTATQEPHYQNGNKVQVGKVGIGEEVRDFVRSEKKFPDSKRPQPGEYLIKRTICTKTGEWAYDLQKIGEDGEVEEAISETALKHLEQLAA